MDAGRTSTTQGLRLDNLALLGTTNVSVKEIPEPSSIALFALGLVAPALFLRRRRAGI
jgi:hypothetical protein